MRFCTWAIPWALSSMCVESPYLGAQSRKATRRRQNQVKIPLRRDFLVFGAQHAERTGVIFLRLLGPDLVAKRDTEFFLAFQQRPRVGERPWPELPADLFGQDRHQCRRQRGPAFERAFGTRPQHA